MDFLNRQKIENELQLKTINSKIIPHFTKNVLSAIGNFAMTDKLKAAHYISVFSKFTQLTLANADKNFIRLEDELSYTKTYLDLEKMRFNDKFDYEISVGENVDKSLLIPTMAMHTYCDNAIRHGLVNKHGAGKLEIKIRRQNNGVMISVSDNGIGRERAKKLGTSGSEHGLNLMSAQIDFYNYQNKEKIFHNITDLVDNEGKANGTLAELFIPDGFVY